MLAVDRGKLRPDTNSQESNEPEDRTKGDTVNSLSLNHLEPISEPDLTYRERADNEGRCLATGVSTT